VNRVLWLVSVGLLATSSLPAQELKMKEEFRNHGEDVVAAMTASLDNKIFATAGGPDSGTIRVWNMVTDKTIAIFHIENRGDIVFSLAVSPDGKTLAAGFLNGKIRLWDVASKTNTFTMEGDTVFVVFSPDGKNLISGGGDVQLWNVADGKKIASLKDEKMVASCAAFSSDGKLLATAGDQLIRLWDMSAGKDIDVLRLHRIRVHSAAFSPDGKTLALGADTKDILLLDVATVKVVATLEGQKGSVGKVAFSPDGKTLATTGNDNTISLWNVATRKRDSVIEQRADIFVRKTSNGRYSPAALCWGPDGKTLVSTSPCRGTWISLWEVKSKSDEDKGE
jgi:WD40 repeat protein